MAEKERILDLGLRSIAFSQRDLALFSTISLHAETPYCHFHMAMHPSFHTPPASIVSLVTTLAKSSINTFVNSPRRMMIVRESSMTICR